MKVHVDAVEASKAIKAVGSVIGSRPVSNVLAGIQMTTLNEGPDSELILRATNGAVDITRVIPCGADERGSVLLDGKKLAAIFSTLPNGQVEIAAEEGKPAATIKTKGRAKFTLAITSGELPARPDVGEESLTATMNADDLKSALDTVKYAVATDQTRMILTGILLEVYGDKMNAVALDGYRLALSQKPCESNAESEGVKVAIPGESLAAVMAALDGSREATIVSDGKQLMVKGEYAYTTTGLLVGEYIDYRKIIPRDYKASIRFLGRDMLDALKRANALGKINLVKLGLQDAMAVVESNTASDAFYEEVPCQHSGDDMDTAYNVKYFMECLNATDADELQLDLISPVSAGVVRRTDGQRELHLMLPVRIMNGGE